MGILKEIMSWIIITLTVVQSSTCKHFPSSSFPTCRTLVFRECETWLWLLIHSENRDLNFFWFCVVSALPPFLVCVFVLFISQTNNGNNNNNNNNNIGSKTLVSLLVSHYNDPINTHTYTGRTNAWGTHCTKDIAAWKRIHTNNSTCKEIPLIIIILLVQEI